MKILITGGAGFLGSHLAEWLLREKHCVIILDNKPLEESWKINHLEDNPRLEFYCGSILDKALLEKLVKKCEKIFHFAAVVGVEHYVKRPLDVLSINVEGTRLLLELAFKYNKKVIFASTSEIYGKSKKIPFKEDDDRILGPTTIDRWCYSTSKAAAEHYCFAYKKMGLKVVILRFFNVYGPRLDSLEAGRVLSIFMGQLLRKKPLTVIGDGRQTRCFIYIDDAINAIIKASEAKKAEGRVLNIGTDQEMRILDLAKKMIKLFGEKRKIKFIKSEGKYGLSYEDIPRRVPEISKARRILNFKPRISLEEGLSKTIKWYKENYKKSKFI